MDTQNLESGRLKCPFDPQQPFASVMAGKEPPEPGAALGPAMALCKHRGSADATAGAPLALVMFPGLVCALRAGEAFRLQTPESWKGSSTNRGIRVAVKPLSAGQEGGFTLTQSLLL